MEDFTLVTGLVILIGAVLILVVLNYFVPLGLWLTAYFSDVPVSLATMIGMRLRKVPPSGIINPLINATKAGLDLKVGEMEAHFLAGGNVDRVVNHHFPVTCCSIFLASSQRSRPAVGAFPARRHSWHWGFTLDRNIWWALPASKSFS